MGGTDWKVMVKKRKLEDDGQMKKKQKSLKSSTVVKELDNDDNENKCDSKRGQLTVKGCAN